MSKIQKQLHLLESLKPEASWKEDTKRILFSQIEAQGMGATKPGITSGVWAYVRAVLSGLHQFTLGAAATHPSVLVLALIAVVFGGSVVNISAQGTLPGDPLYTVKKTGESIQVALTPAGDRASLQMELVGKRLAELDAISRQPLSDEEKARLVEAVVSDVSVNLATAKQHLDEIKGTERPERVAQVAQNVRAQSAEAERVLKVARQTAPLTTADQKVKEVIQEAYTTSSDALAVVVEKKVAAGVSDDEVSHEIEAQIARVEAQVGEVKTAAESVASDKSGEADKKVKVTQKTKEAEERLKRARTSLEKKDYSLALSMVNESQSLAASLEDDIDALSEAVDVEEGVEEEILDESEAVEESEGDLGGEVEEDQTVEDEVVE